MKKHFRKTAALCFLGLLVACADSTVRSSDDGKTSVYEAARYAEQNKNKYPTTVVVVNDHKTQIWKVPHAGYTFAVLKLKFSGIKISWFRPQEAVPAIEKFTGCKIPPGTITFGRRTMDVGQVVVIELAC